MSFNLQRSHNIDPDSTSRVLDHNHPYMPGLDGIRAVAVLAVIAYHFNWAIAAGGLLGVGVFFVLSGYLISDLLFEERRRNGRIHLGRFWRRRIRRLLPAMLIMLIVVALFLDFTDTGGSTAFSGDIWSSLTYTSNWYFIYHHVSYFESFGPPSPFGHLWSLAVEEQFYLIWPLILVTTLHLLSRPTRGKMILLILVGAAASFASMVLLYEPGTDPSRVYYGTDTRAFGLLIGAALALICPSRKLAEPSSRKGAARLDSLGIIGFCVVMYMLVRTGKYDESLYLGGMFIFSLASALIIAAAASPFSAVGRLLGWRPLRWLGVRSYGIYLWHYPVIVLTSPSDPNMSPNLVLQLFQLSATIVLAVLSYKYVEEPIRNGKWKPFKMSVWKKVEPMKKGKRAAILFSVGTIILICVACTQSEGSNQASSETSEMKPNVTSSENLKPSESPPLNQSTSTPGNHVAQDSKSSLKTQNSSASNAEITAIGDSVLVGVTPYLEKVLPGIVIDGKVGRQMSEAKAVVEQLKSKKKLGKNVIIELGTNGTFSSNKLEDVLDAIGRERQIFLVNTRLPKDWQDAVNKTLAKAVEGRSNVTLVDWYTFSAQKSDWFTKDGVHLQPDGAKAYASYLAESIRKSGR
ncbi:acyltransferase family protein [Paenibacillus alba]|uniref:Acyltransferase family protein n=1 Tax=Paenibacillus alba TaxID=1197127 RepID=A0ABU6FUV1_9BACL|nr:acyltransferase family protein [Paenibacillus alba]MEC0225650.1 acyltransferase family protein [Paenibacillus alba]